MRAPPFVAAIQRDAVVTGCGIGSPSQRMLCRSVGTRIPSTQAAGCDSCLPFRVRKSQHERALCVVSRVYRGKARGGATGESEGKPPHFDAANCTTFSVSLEILHRPLPCRWSLDAPSPQSVACSVERYGVTQLAAASQRRPCPASSPSCQACSRQKAARSCKTSTSCGSSGVTRHCPARKPYDLAFMPNID